MGDPIIGIDLGTTNSLVGVVDSGFPILLADDQGRRILPSAVHYPDSAGPLIGEAALRMRSLEPHRTITSIKRLMGRRFDEIEQAEFSYKIARGPNDIAVASVGDKLKSPQQVSADILRRLKEIAESALETDISSAVITVPAYFNDAQRNATKEAGELAGLTVERIVNEPTAAALAYGLDKLGDRSRVAVFDLGGGTFDISILELNEGVFQVVATTGDTRLGGDDIDQALSVWLMDQIELESSDPEIRVRILEACRKAKEELSQKDEVEIQLPFLGGSQSYSKTLNRPQFEKLIRRIIERTRPHCLKALADAGIAAPKEDLDEVILVGGSTRIPAVRQIASEIFAQEPNTSQHPDEAVALGASIQAGILSGALRNMVLLDVTPLSLGIETFGGLMNVIIPRNSTIPTKAGELFTNAVANQRSMLIRVLQGEREMARDNWDLGQFEIEFEEGPKGSARVGVQFEIDENGILTILARDTKTNSDRILEIQSAAVDVEDDQVEQMISESVDYAFEDMNERIWTEAKMKSEELLPAVESAFAQIGDQLKAEDRGSIESAAAQVRAALEADPPDVQRLKKANQQLDEATEHLAAILVEKAMERALEQKGLT